MYNFGIKLTIIIFLFGFKVMQAFDVPSQLAAFQSTVTTITTTKNKYTLMNQWSSNLHQNQPQQQQVAVNNDNEELAPSTNLHNPEKPSNFFKPPRLRNDDIQQFKFDQKSQIVGPTNRDEGSFCRRSFDGRSGYCIVAYQCLHVIQEYRLHGSKIDVCTYKRNIPIICCPLEEKHVEDERISALKCKEYNNEAKNIKWNTKAKRFSGKQCVSSIPMIVGGTETQKDEYPHMASLGLTQSEEGIKWICGGTLISEHFVLTAGHCVTSESNPPNIIRLGDQQLNGTSPWHQDINVLTIILHPKYRSSSNYHDIALLKLVRPATLTTRVRPACLWQLPELHTNQVTAAGWGRTEFRGPRSNVLLKVDLNIIDQKLCKKLYRSERRLSRGIIDEQFCAGYLPGGKDTCQGDSGGPLHAKLPEYNCISFVVGVTSFGKFCAAPNAPGVYTKIYPYLDWIENIIFRI